MTTFPNGPAFPESDLLEDGIVTTVSGLTKREYFAAMAMQAMVIVNQLDPRNRANASKNDT